ncbi:glycoside hydrolase superfamily [Syncephalastrum racemosum]|uniref:Alpha-galactosidase n=1 Tax=Syncephalastrum racemosum TaxID=13706 RepID=A0A1X2H2R4_SYNRA|nr:glycoside hydrolase superfamily [Syncephalastrum racemosum]
MIHLLSLLLLLCCYHVLAEESAMARTPPMGWNSWNKYGCEIHQDLIKETVDTMVDRGFKAAGYSYVNLDDCWQSNERHDNGTILIDTVAFPDGMKALGDYIHDKGLQFGIYSSAGRKTCAGRVASLGFETQDAASYAEWGIDYLKYDNCNYDEGLAAEPRFEQMRVALNATGRDIFYSICTWGVENTWEWAPSVGHSFRTHDDIYNGWKSIVEILDVHAKVVHLGGIGHWADPDMLEIGNGQLTTEESRTHFSLWAAMKAPLILGSNLKDMAPELFDIVTHAQVIAINQDALGMPATRMRHARHDHDVWAGPLSDGKAVAVLINFKSYPVTFTLDYLGSFYTGPAATFHDVWSNVTRRLDQTDNATTTLPAHGCALHVLANGTWSPRQRESASVPALREDDRASRRYEAEDLVNQVHGLARRKGCKLCSGGAYVMALGNVNRPQTGSVTFRNITALANPYGTIQSFRLTVGYLDCFSWSTCGDFFTRRWHTRISLVEGNTTVSQLWVALKSKRNPTVVSLYTAGVRLVPGKSYDIAFENPDGYAASVDYIELTLVGEDSDPTAGLFPVSGSHDRLAAYHSDVPRILADFGWEIFFLLVALSLQGWLLCIVWQWWIAKRRRNDNRYIYCR